MDAEVCNINDIHVEEKLAFNEKLNNRSPGSEMFYFPSAYSVSLPVSCPGKILKNQLGF